MWLVAQYFGCMELVRREAPFVPVTRKGDRRALQHCLEAVRKAFASDGKLEEPVFLVHRAWQRAIGELMIVHDASSDKGLPKTRCMGYAEFVRVFHHDDSGVGGWCQGIADDVGVLAESADRRERVYEIQHALIDLVKCLDPKFIYFPEGQRLRALEPED